MCSGSIYSDLTTFDKEFLMTTATRILRLPAVRERLGLSRSTIYDRMNPRSPRYDASFPIAVKLGGVAVGWTESSVDEWLQQRITLAMGKRVTDGLVA